ncbi:caspase family protein [Altericista sp. CCNU0014]|uniref:caspase family protein n=1 Tax=Altericista sp. CCNU0014 TaxID=3082949 RepID=UPI00384B1F69
MSLTRRELIRQAGLTSAGLWLGNASLAQRYQTVLAQATSRKLALLVGIDRYPRGRNIVPLRGSVTDVDLQRELLMHRFGFSRQDILTLVDAEATRSNIETAFTAHLIEQVRPGDIVVFHFSGYGCLMRAKTSLEKGEQPYGDRQVLVPYDVELPDATSGGMPLLNGIYEDTLFLLLRSLSTDRVTTLLDCGILPVGGLRCKSLRERALPPWEVEAPLAAELAFQDRLLAQTQLTRDQVQVQRQSGQLPGLVLAAAAAQSMALEQDRDGFSAGIFSAGLTQQLWADTPAANITIQFGKLSAQLVRHNGPGTQPTVRGQKSLGMLPWSGEFTPMPQTVGFVTLVDRRGQTAKLWLGGLPDALLEHYQVQSCFHALKYAKNPSADVSTIPPAVPTEGAGSENRPIDAPSSEVNAADRSEATATTLVQLRSRQGWTAIARHLSGPLLEEALFLEEAIRVLPRAISLRLALGNNLSRIERVDATSVVSMARNSLQMVRTEQPADYVFTKIPMLVDASAPLLSGPSFLTLPIEPPPTASYGLAYLGGAVIPNTVGDRGEVVKRAIERLQPTLDTLLAMKLLELSLNDGTAALRVSATLEQVEESPQPLIRVQSARFAVPLPAMVEMAEPVAPRAEKSSKAFSIPSGTRIQYRLSNWDTTPVYVLLVGFNGGTSAFASYAIDGNPIAERKPILKPIAIQPGSSLVLPVAAQAWKASAVAGLNEIFVVCTRQPLAQTLAAQTNGMKLILPSISPGFAALPKPLAIAQSIFADLHQASLPETSALGISGKNLWALDLREWATLQLIYTTT